MNILLTNAGKQRSVIRHFQAALNGFGKVVAADASPIADLHCLVPPIDAPEYIASLIAICDKHHIDLLIPMMEQEMMLLDEHRERFKKVGTKVLVSSRKVILTCYDKLAAAEFLVGCGIACPHSYLSLSEVCEALLNKQVEFPMVVKSRWGSDSSHCEFAGTFEELESVVRLLEIRAIKGEPEIPDSELSEHRILIQGCLKGDEYGLDVINDLEGKYVCTFVRRKLRMRSGNTDWATTLSHRWLENLGRCIGEKLGHIGLLDCDLFLSGDACEVIDINPRMGSGYPFSHLAGANYPAALVAWMRQKKPDPLWLHVRPNITVSRCDDFEIVGRAEMVGGAV